MHYNILIIEDKKTDREIYKGSIYNVMQKLRVKKEHLIIDEVDTYRKALYRISRNKYDIIIVDKKIPGGQGDKLIISIRKMYPFQRIIFITAYPASEVQQSIINPSIHAYIEKNGDYRMNLENAMIDIISKKIKCFIIMPYKPIFLRFYETKIKPFIQQLGFKPILAKDIFCGERIIDKVKKGLIESFFVISDFSELNANVFYETGIAHQMKKPTIIITQNIKNIPSDLKDRYYFKYSKTNFTAFRTDLEEKISDIDISN